VRFGGGGGLSQAGGFSTIQTSLPASGGSEAKLIKMEEDSKYGSKVIR